MSKFTKLTFVAVFALLIIASLFAVEARDLNRRQEGDTPSGKGGKSALPTGTGTDATPTGTDVPTDVPTDAVPTDAVPTAPTDTGVPSTGAKASDIASILNSAAKSGAYPTPSSSPSPSGASGSGPATTPSSANKIGAGFIGIVIAGLVCLFL